ncbi:MAG TPA: sulfite exporter TauE/SafE family protein, partial [Gemmatimonadales bacterium]|nr:sulfite exporter TauE/SafE family protein [Gemmatimonadales bacterium]
MMVPFMYVVYRSAPVTVSAQTVVAHATSLGVAFVTSTFGTWHYSRVKAVAWRAATAYAVPGILSAFLVARLLTRVHEVHWVRAAFGVFLLVSAADMARRAMIPHPVH